MKLVSQFAAALFVCACPGAFAQDLPIDPEEAFSTMVAKYHACDLFTPNESETNDSSNRVGAVIGVNREYLAPPPKSRRLYRGRIFSRDINAPWCTPDEKYPLPQAASFQKIYDFPEQQRSTEMGLGFQLEVAKLFNGLSISWENIKAVSFEVSNAHAYTLSPGRQEAVMDNMVAQNTRSCNRALNAANSQMIIRVCTGKVTLGVYFKNAVSGSALNIAISQIITAGFNGKYQEEAASVTPCQTARAGSGSGTQPSNTSVKPKDGTASAPSSTAKLKDGASSTPTKKPKDASSTSTSPTGKTKPISFAASVGGISLQGSVTDSNSGSNTAGAKDGSASSGAGQPSTPITSKADASKCYSFAKVVGPDEGVFGVKLSPDTGPDSVASLLKLSLQKKK
ncbi:hypothetical protein [Bradyrhizobium sp. SZCCHNRI3042]|uniref:hypothetical protein n=1 Tax=Bradyrhizobium sp. SZCCHNRI3042 TaxID=3057291 RepID=UPI002915FB3D|nr:hypothetical protein [Bradyrhizobium sp. SZCCHNRI3042]